MGKTFAEWFGEDLTGQTYDGDIACSREGLTSLKGAPKIVKGSFWCDKNKLTSLEGGPQEVGKNFDCSGNQLTSLKGGPQKVGGMYECDNNKLTSLEGAPKETESFSCFKNQLTSLKGAPKEVWGNFYCYDNPLTSLEGKPQMIYLNFRSDFDEKSTNNSNNDDFEEAPPFSLNNDLPPEVEDFLFDETYYSDVPEMGDFVEENSDKEFMAFEVPDLMEQIRDFALNLAEKDLMDPDIYEEISDAIDKFLEDNADYFNESKISTTESKLLRDVKKILNESDDLPSTDDLRRVSKNQIDKDTLKVLTEDNSSRYLDSDKINEIAFDFVNKYGNQYKKLQKDINNYVKRERSIGIPGRFDTQISDLRNQQHQMTKELAEQIKDLSEEEILQIINTVVKELGLPFKHWNNFAYQVVSVPIDGIGKTLADIHTGPVYLSDKIGEFKKEITDFI